jgi:ribose transport system permease protein
MEKQKKGLKLVNKGLRTELILLAILGVLFLIIGFNSPVFFKVNTLLALLRQASIYGIIAIGMTYVIVSGGIDLSVGAVVGLSGVIVAMGLTSGMGIILSILFALAASVVVGIFNGVLVNDFKVPPFIATLASLTIVRNTILLITGARTISNLPNQFKKIASGTLFRIPNLFVILFVVIIVAYFIATKTVFGRNVYSYGSNKEAARLSGINVRKTIYGVYAFSALLSGIAGVLLSARLGNGVPTSGTGYELDAIAASVVGGASLDGGEGSVLGTALGSLIMATLRQGGTLLGMNSFIVEIIIGSLIAIAVIIDKTKKTN